MARKRQFRERVKIKLIARLKELKGRFEFKLVSTPVRARVRRLRARWTVELDQDLQAFYNIRAEQHLVRVLTQYARKKLNKKFYGKVVIRGKRNRNANKAAGHRTRGRNVRA